MGKRVRKQRQLYRNLCELTDPVLVEDESEMNQANTATTLAMWGALIAADNIGTPSTNYGCLGSINELPVHHYIYSFLSAKKKNPDIFSFDEVMSEPDPKRLAQWKVSAVKEITELENKNVWEECLKSEANDKGVKIVPSTWVFRIKRTPDGEFSKCKARICLQGDLMDVNAEVFAPVVAWQTVCLFLVLSLNLGWPPTVSVDWCNAFVQTPLETPIYMQTPRGFVNKFGYGGCLRLRKNVYGSAFGPRYWFEHLRRGLKRLGMRESDYDPCFLYKTNMLMVLYVDDAGIAAPDKSIIVKFVEDLR